MQNTGMFLSCPIFELEYFEALVIYKHSLMGNSASTGVLGKENITK